MDEATALPLGGRVDVYVVFSECSVPTTLGQRRRAITRSVAAVSEPELAATRSAANRWLVLQPLTSKAAVACSPRSAVGFLRSRSSSETICHLLSCNLHWGGASSNFFSVLLQFRSLLVDERCGSALKRTRRCNPIMRSPFKKMVSSFSS
jgi:hypothetical protein